VKDKLKEDFTINEIKVLKMIRYEFEFDVPFKYLEYYGNQYFN
jgi:hypothetical protein